MTSRGSTLIELLVAMGLTTIVAAGVLALVQVAHETYASQPQSMDVQQRLRSAADQLRGDLAAAGTLPAASIGSMVHRFPPVVPYRIGTTSRDPELAYFSDRITVVGARERAIVTTVREALDFGQSGLLIDLDPGCPLGGSICGLEAGARAVVFDERGTFDLITVEGSSASVLQILPRRLTKHYVASEGARVVAVEASTYYLDRAARQLRRFDGHRGDFPIADEVVDLAFRYFGDPAPPSAPRPLAGEANCLFAADGSSLLPTLTADPFALVELMPAMLTDGPMCGDSPNRYDADLLRLRQIRVTLRVQVTAESARGQDAAQHTNPGTANRATVIVADREVTFEVTPPALQAWRH
jgi:hypothetical protein